MSSIKAGQLVQVGNNIVFDRIQNGGPGNLNVPTEHIYELGNYKGIATIRDIPDLTYTLESFDASAQIEAILTGNTFSSAVYGTTGYSMGSMLPLDVASEFKAGLTATSPFNVAGSAVAPYLVVDSLSYRFGLHNDAAQTVGLRGDSLFYNTGSAFIETFAGTNTANQTYTLVNHAYPYNGDVINGTRYTLGATVAETGQRLLLGTDYTETATGVGNAKTVTLTILAAVPSSQHVRVVYQSDTVATYLQTANATVTALRPAAIRGKDIELRIGGKTVTSRWTSVQSVQLDWKVNLQRDEEFGSASILGQDYVVPTVTGQITIKPQSTAELLTRLQQVTGVTNSYEVMGPQSTTAVLLEVILHSPYDGTVLKTLQVPDARFTLPGYLGRVQQKVSVDLKFEGDSGDFTTYVGLAP